MTTIYVLEATDETTTAGWSESACGDIGYGLTRFGTPEAAEFARAGLVALGEGWTDENTRVREVRS